MGFVLFTVNMCRNVTAKFLVQNKNKSYLAPTSHRSILTLDLDISVLGRIEMDPAKSIRSQSQVVYEQSDHVFEHIRLSRIDTFACKERLLNL